MKLCLFAASALILTSCAIAPRLAPRFSKPSTGPLEQAHKQAITHVQSAEEKADRLAKDNPKLKLQIFSIRQDLDSALTSLASSESARKVLDQQLKDYADKANRLADDYDKVRLDLTKHEATFKEVNSYWGLGAFGYGLKVLVHHLIILAAVIIGFLALAWVVGMAFPAVGAGLRVGGAFLASAINKVKAAIQRKNSP